MRDSSRRRMPTNESTHTFQSRASLALKRWSFRPFGDKKMRTTAIAVAGTFIAAVALAFPVHRYSGLEELTERSSDIALIRVNAHVAGDGQTYDTYNVTFVETFKGNILTNTIRDIALAHIQLSGSFGSTEAGFQPNQEYLVFLEPNSFTNVAGTHRNVPIIGSCWKLRPDVDWEADPNQTIQSRIESLFDSQGWKKQGTEQKKD